MQGKGTATKSPPKRTAFLSADNGDNRLFHETVGPDLFHVVFAGAEIFSSLQQYSQAEKKYSFPFEFRLKGEPTIALYHLCTNFCAVDETFTCDGGNPNMSLNGRWFFGEFKRGMTWTSANLLEFISTIGTRRPSNGTWHMASIRSPVVGIQWVAACSIPWYHSENLPSCLDDKNVTFTGDSHTRFAYWNLGAHGLNRTFNARYFEMRFGEDVEGSLEDIRKGEITFVNFGHWVAAAKIHNGQKPLDTYRKRLDTLFQKIRTTMDAHPGTQFIWEDLCL